jgi:hypothetical protein
MKTKIICFLVMTLMIATSIQAVGAIMKDNSTVREISDDYSNLIQQVIGSNFIRGGWLEQDKLLASDGATTDVFGISVSIDGDYALIGADGDDAAKGSAYVFKRDGTIWTEEQKLLASDGATGDRFGRSVSINGDYALIGAPGDDTWKGSAYVFKRDGTIWTEEQKLLASDGATNDIFGISVSIDGDYALIGAYGDDTYKGSAFVFKRDGAIWTEEQKLTASDGATGDYFGWSVSINGDYALIGADGDDTYKGSAYVFIKESENQPPGIPTITGETNGDAGTEYEYTFNAVDPDSDNVKYHIDWDDGDTETTDFFSSGTDVKVKHTWTNQDTYIIRVTAEDTNGLIGPEGTLSVTMPRNKIINRPLLQLLQSYPILFPILRQLLGL